MNAAAIHMQKVESSNIEAIGHDAVSNELHVRFKNGGHYVHAGVHRAFYQNMLAAKSAGKYYADAIKGVFDHRKLK